MKVLLISTSFDDDQRCDAIQLDSHYPLGLAYLHSYLEYDTWDNEVKTLFLNDYPFEACYIETINTLKEFKPDVVGFNILTNNRTTSYVMINYIEEFYPNIKIVCGGIHTSVMYEQILNNISDKVICVIGEGELTFKELLDKNFSEIYKISGLAFKEDGFIIKTPEREHIKDLDILPFPNHGMYMNPYRFNASILTSRGCPFKCSFCVLDSISRRRVRFRSVSNVVDEIEYISKQFPQILNIWIHDDNFTISNERAINICKEIINRNIKMRFVCSARVKPFSKELIGWLERAGFIQVLFGVESFNDKVLKNAHKGFKKQDAIDTITMFKDSKIIVTAFLITGLYGETDETIKETWQTINEIQKVKDLYYKEIGVSMVYPGCEIFNQMKENNLIDESYWLQNKDIPFFTLEYSKDKLFEMKEELLKHIRR